MEGDQIFKLKENVGTNTKGCKLSMDKCGGSLKGLVGEEITWF